MTYCEEDILWFYLKERRKHASMKTDQGIKGKLCNQLQTSSDLVPLLIYLPIQTSFYSLRQNSLAEIYNWKGRRFLRLNKD